MQKRGKKVPIGLFDDSLKLGPFTAIKTQRYLVKDKLADFVTGNLSVTLKLAGVDAAAFRDALKAAEIRFVVQRYVFPEASLINSLLGLDRSREIDLSTKAGFVSPYELLVVTDFSYRSDATSLTQGGASLTWLPAIEAAVGKKQLKRTESEVDVADYSVVAFKSVPYPPMKYTCK